jgi:hypothetical protein
MASIRNSAGINKAGGRNVNPVYKAVKSVTSYVGNVGRELRDLPTAIGTGSLGETKLQLKEAAAALTANQRGRATQHRKASGEMEFGMNVRGIKPTNFKKR